MAVISLPVKQTNPKTDKQQRSFALVGNPNAGKTLLFNAMTGMRAHTANFSGTTVDYRIGRIQLDAVGQTRVIDLPGLYGLDAVNEDERVAECVLRGQTSDDLEPDVVLVVIDATNLERGLFLASQTLALGKPTIVALNMIDLARRSRIEIDKERLEKELGCSVVPVSARTGEGMPQLLKVLSETFQNATLPVIPEAQAACCSCKGCPFTARYNWAEAVASSCGTRPIESHGRLTEAIDRFLTHPVVGVVAFIGIMLGIFYMIFSLAAYPMDMIEAGFGWAGEIVGSLVPEGDLHSLLVDGVIGGVGGVLVFLPQIAILFFFITLLEDTGYMARAAFVMDRLMSRFGLPGKAFVPMLSAHACAVPAIMSTRVVEDWRDRLVTILVLPMLTCSARLPVYAMVTVLLFRDQPAMAAVLFTGAYLLGIGAALGSAFLFKRTILPGDVKPLVIDLPNYKIPSLKAALLTTWDRATMFIRKAGTTILLISVVLWAMATYPKMPEESLPAATAQQVQTLHDQAAALQQAAADTPGEQADDALVQAEELRHEADHLIAQRELEYSFAGRLGKAFEPVFKPLGFNWQINVGVISSFAAREVIVSTLSIVYGVGEEAADSTSVLSSTLSRQTRADGSAMFDTPTCLSLLVFYVLAMQCLPTQVVTRRETGKWRWALFQLGYMTVLAYTAAMVTYQVASLLT